MFGNAKPPGDPFPYLKARGSHQLTTNTPTGKYVFVVDLNDVIHVAPDGPHMHPQVLGYAESALYAGELSIDSPGLVDEITNLSGTFRFKSRKSLCCVASGLRQLGFGVQDVSWYPPTGGTPVLLTCA
jgi:hypothetical protein